MEDEPYQFEFWPLKYCPQNGIIPGGSIIESVSYPNGVWHRVIT
jgi:hypothetical protein